MAHESGPHRLLLMDRFPSGSRVPALRGPLDARRRQRVAQLADLRRLRFGAYAGKYSVTIWPSESSMNSRTIRLRCAGKRSQTIINGPSMWRTKAFRKVDDLQLANRAGIEPKVKVAQRQPGRHRKLLPIEVELQQRRLAARRPGAATMRLLTQSAFVDEDDRAVLFSGFFLMAGHLLHFQSRMASSLRSRALPTGRCGLQRSARRIFQTWPS